MDNTTVKINKELLKRVDKIICKGSASVKYASKKHFVNVAVLELIRKEESNKKGDKE